jgi:hypothetical protein
MATTTPTPSHYVSGASCICADTDTLVPIPGLPPSATVLPSLRHTFVLHPTPTGQWVLCIYTAPGTPSTGVHLDAAVFSGTLALASSWDHAVLLDIPSGCAHALDLQGGPRGGATPIPQPLPIQGRVTSVACGEKHSAAVVEGRVYTWGASRCNALGLWGGAEEGGGSSALPSFAVPAPTDALPVNALLNSDGSGEVFTSVHSGWGFCCALSSHARIAVWGSNKYGQCALPPCRWVAPAWVHLGGEDPGYLRASSLSCGWSHCIAFKAAIDSFLTWGRGDMGQLGRVSVTNADHTPGAVAGIQCTCSANNDGGGGDGGDGGDASPPPQPPIAVCGSESTIVALPCGQCVWAWGWNEHGNLGVGGGLESRWEPTQVALPLGMKVVHLEGVKAAGATLIVELCQVGRPLL